MIERVKIGLFDYTITEVDKPGDPEDERSLHAYIQYSTCAIQLRREMNADMKAVALLHEILHAIGRSSGLEFIVENTIEETFVVTFSHGLVALLRDNPELVKYLTGDLND